jgi:hypothetical protein
MFHKPLRYFRSAPVRRNASSKRQTHDSIISFRTWRLFINFNKSSVIIKFSSRNFVNIVWETSIFANQTLNAAQSNEWGSKINEKWIRNWLLKIAIRKKIVKKSFMIYWLCSCSQNITYSCVNMKKRILTRLNNHVQMSNKQKSNIIS